MKRYRPPGLVWALVVAILLLFKSVLPSLIFVKGIALVTPHRVILSIYFLLSVLVVCACSRYLLPLLERHYPTRLAMRMVFGLLIVFSSVVLATIPVYFHLFPAMIGRQVFPIGLLEVVLQAIMASVFVFGWLILRSHTSAAAEQAFRIQFDTSQLATDLDRSELAMLEAQIEPHFLFNTLAHVKRLYRVDAATADEVLTTLIAYLERALPALRRMDWTIGDELDLIALYLGILEQRFAGRLQHVIDAPADSRRFQIPALTIATLVENAVRHGLGPKAGAGMVRVSVTHNGQELRVDVADDGVGLRQSSGSGLGLATIKARLRSKFAQSVQVTVEPNAGAGVLASIRIASKEMADA